MFWLLFYLHLPSNSALKMFFSPPLFYLSPSLVPLPLSFVCSGVHTEGLWNSGRFWALCGTISVLPVHLLLRLMNMRNLKREIQTKCKSNVMHYKGVIIFLEGIYQGQWSIQLKVQTVQRSTATTTVDSWESRNVLSSLYGHATTTA